MSARLDRHLRGPRGGGRLKPRSAPEPGAWERRAFHGLRGFASHAIAAGVLSPRSPRIWAVALAGLCTHGRAPRGVSSPREHREPLCGMETPMDLTSSPRAIVCPDCGKLTPAGRRGPLPTGPSRHPRDLVYLGDLDKPLLPDGGSSSSKRDRRLWRCAFTSLQTRVIARCGIEYMKPEDEPRLQRVYRAYQLRARGLLDVGPPRDCETSRTITPPSPVPPQSICLLRTGGCAWPGTSVIGSLEFGRLPPTSGRLRTSQTHCATGTTCCSTQTGTSARGWRESRTQRTSSRTWLCFLPGCLSTQVLGRPGTSSIRGPRPGWQSVSAESWTATASARRCLSRTASACNPQPTAVWFVEGESELEVLQLVDKEDSGRLDQIGVVRDRFGGQEESRISHWPLRRPKPVDLLYSYL